MPSFLLPEELLGTSPSRSAGITEEVETTNRIFGCELIAQAGIMLRLSQAATTTAQILFHRFFYRKSMIDYEVLQVAMTSVFLATKIEESQRQTRDILNVFDRLLKRRYYRELSVFDRTSKRYNKWEAKMRKVELVMLKEMGYTVYVDHPHRFILFYVRTIYGNQDLTDASKQLAQRAWNFLNDAMRTDVCLRYRPESIATAAIYLTARVLSIRLPSNPPWYHLFGATRMELEEISSIISELYTREKAEYIPVSEKDKKTNLLFRWREESKTRKKEAATANVKKQLMSSSSSKSSAKGGSGGGGGGAKSGAKRGGEGGWCLVVPGGAWWWLLLVVVVACVCVCV